MLLSINQKVLNSILVCHLKFLISIVIFLLLTQILFPITFLGYKIFIYLELILKIHLAIY